jgi:hypothetical protein
MRVYREQQSVTRWLQIGGCGICGSEENLHQHHLLPEHKKFPVGGKKRVWWAFLIELCKTVTLCKDCHVQVHNHNGQLSIVNNFEIHGD